MSETESYEGLDAPAQENLSNTNDSQDDNFKPHPAHEKLLAELPAAWHDKVIPFLQEQDRAYQQQLEKFTPYKEYIDNDVDPAYIQQSIQLAQAIAEDPLAIHKNLTEALMAQGLIEAEASKQAIDFMSDTAENFSDEELPESFKKELAARDEKLNNLEEYINKQELDRETAQELSVIEAELTGLRDVYEVSPRQETAIVELMESALIRGENLSVIDAARKLVELTGQGFVKIGNTDLSAPAPVVLGSGGNSVPFENVSVPKDDKGKRAMMAQLFAQQYGNA